MKAIVAKEAGDANVLELIEVSTPTPNENEVLIKVKSLGINPVDYKIRPAGFGRSFPMIIGNDVSGVIVVRNMGDWATAHPSIPPPL